MTVTTTNPNGHILRLLLDKNEVPTPEKIEHLFTMHESEIKGKIIQLEQDRAEISNSGMRDEQSRSSDDIKKRVVDLKQDLKEQYNWSVTFSTSFGSTNISRTWLDKYGHIDKKVFALLLSGLDLDFNDEYLDNAITQVKPKPKCVIVSPDQMYGRNIRTCQSVTIIGTGIRRETRDQAAARAGRDTIMDTPIVALYIDPSILNCHGPNAKRSIDTLQLAVNPHKKPSELVHETSIEESRQSMLGVKEGSDQSMPGVKEGGDPSMLELNVKSTECTGRNMKDPVPVDDEEHIEASIIEASIIEASIIEASIIERVQKDSAENLPLGRGGGLWQAEDPDDGSNFKENNSPRKKLPGSQRAAEKRKAKKREAAGKKKADVLPCEKENSSTKSLNKHAEDFVPSLLK